MNLEERVKRLERELRDLKKKNETWIKAPAVIKLTGWDREGMRTARENGYVKFKKDENGFWYLLESINSIFIKDGSLKQDTELQLSNLQGVHH